LRLGLDNTLRVWYHEIEEERTMADKRRPTRFEPGTRVKDIYTGAIKTVSTIYWQEYAGGDTSDYTVVFVEGGWNKSQNLDRADTGESQ
jgi:hypothetical protein